MSEVKKCLKCNGEMVKGNYLSGYGAVRFIKFGDFRGDKVIPFYCKNCGYIELFKQMKKE